MVAPKRIFIFSIALGAENLSYVKSIETHARTFFTLNILSIGTVKSEINDNVMNIKWIVNLLFWKFFKLSVFYTLCDGIHPTKSLYHLLNPSSHLN